MWECWSPLLPVHKPPLALSSLCSPPLAADTSIINLSVWRRVRGRHRKHASLPWIWPIHLLKIAPPSRAKFRVEMDSGGLHTYRNCLGLNMSPKSPLYTNLSRRTGIVTIIFKRRYSHSQTCFDYPIKSVLLCRLFWTRAHLERKRTRTNR